MQAEWIIAYIGEKNEYTTNSVAYLTPITRKTHLLLFFFKNILNNLFQGVLLGPWNYPYYLKGSAYVYKQHTLGKKTGLS